MVSSGYCNRSFSIATIGFSNASRLRGRSLSSAATQSRSSSEWIDRSLPLREVLPKQWTGPRKLDTESKDPSSGSIQMYSKSTLSHSDAIAAVEMFEQGFTAKSVAISLDLARSPVQMLYQRWQFRGGAGALVTRDRKQ